MTDEQIRKIQEEISIELRKGLQERFVGEVSNQNTLHSVKAYVRSFMRRYNIEEYRDIKEPKVTINGPELTITWEKE